MSFPFSVNAAESLRVLMVAIVAAVTVIIIFAVILTTRHFCAYYYFWSTFSFKPELPNNGCSQ